MAHAPAELLARIASLELRARKAVEGLAGGRHFSQLRGSSSTFAEHRAYTQGDDIRHLDWKVAARSDKWMIRQYEAETTLQVYFVIDDSASMNFGSGAWTKWDYATWAASALSLLLLNHDDTFQFFLSQNPELASLQGNKTNWTRLIQLLEKTQPLGQDSPTDHLLSILPHLTKRGLVVWISDCLEDSTTLLQSTSQILSAGHDLLVLRPLDSNEIDFRFQGPIAFQDLESAHQLKLDATGFRKAYLDAFHKHADDIRIGLLKQHASFARIRTDAPLDATLSEFLEFREGRLRKEGL